MSGAPDFALGSAVSCLGYTLHGHASTLSGDALVDMARRLDATLRERGVTASSSPFWAFRLDGTEVEIGLWYPVAEEPPNVQMSRATFPEARYVVVQGISVADLWDRFEGMMRWADERSLPWDLMLAHPGGSARLDVPVEAWTIDLNLRLRPPGPRLVTRPTVRYLPVHFSRSPLTDGWEGFVDAIRRVREMATERGRPVEGEAFWRFRRTGREVEFMDGHEVAFTLCLPLRETSAHTGEEGVREQPSGTYATVTHQGAPDQLGFTYELLLNWLAAQGLRWEEGIAVLQAEAEREQDQSKWRIELAARTSDPAETRPAE